MLALAVPGTALAGLYKCARNDGSVIYQEDPCPPGKELRDFERDPAHGLGDSVPRCVPRPDSTTVSRPPRRQVPSRRQAAQRGRTPRQSPSERKFLVPGINEGEVIARVGRPDVSSGGGRKTVRWTYLPAPDDPATITTLTFELGRLVEVERKVVQAR